MSLQFVSVASRCWRTVRLLGGDERYPSRNGGTQVAGPYDGFSHLIWSQTAHMKLINNKCLYGRGWAGAPTGGVKMKSYKVY